MHVLETDMDHADSTAFSLELAAPVVVPTGWFPPAVNCWLIDGDPLTLVDTGPRTEEAFEALTAGIAALGRRVDEIERIIITHAHVDHYGQAQRIADASGADLFVSEGEVRQVSAAYGDILRESGGAAYKRTYGRLGIPEEHLEQLIDDLSRLDRLRMPAREPRRLPHAFEIRETGSTRSRALHFEVLPTPGHTAHHVSLYEPSSRTLIGGDHVLVGRSPPNPLLEGCADGVARRKPLVEHLASLAHVKALGIRRILPGHFQTIEDAPPAIDVLTEKIERRIDRVLRVLDNEERTPYEIAQVLYSNFPARFFLLPVSLVAGCLDVLVERGRATLSERDGMERYGRARHAPADAELTP
jgi:glyoxylase-like metal-dependent hydrolase (beta-lactamase superfamily II)